MGQWFERRSNNSPEVSQLLGSYIWVGLVSLYSLLHPVHGLTSGLQGKSIDIVNAYQRINETVSSLKVVSRDIDNQFHKIYSQAVRLAEKLSVTPSMALISRRQVNGQNQPAKKPEE